LIVGNLVQKGKEFQLSTESGDGRVRAKQWYDTITRTIDEYKDLKRAGFKKLNEVEGKKSTLPDVAVPEKKEVVVEKKLEDVKPAEPKPVVSETRVTHDGNTTVVTKTEINPFGAFGGSASPAPPSPAPTHYDPFAAANPYGAGTPPPNPYGAPAAYVHTPPVAAPVMTTIAPAPYAYPQPTFVQPVVTPVYGMPAPVVSPMMHQCMFCRQVFQKPPTPMFGCPFCGQVNQAAPAAVMTTTYAAPVFY